jgi:hypothetical protein
VKNNCRRSCSNPQFLENPKHARANGLVVEVEGGLGSAAVGIDDAAMALAPWGMVSYLAVLPMRQTICFPRSFFKS